MQGYMGNPGLYLPGIWIKQNQISFYSVVSTTSQVKLWAFTSMGPFHEQVFCRILSGPGIIFQI